MTHYHSLEGVADETARLERELREMRQALADTQRLTKTGNWTIDPLSGAASMSAEGYRILGLPGKTSSDHFMECLAKVHPDDLPAVLHAFQESVSTGESRPLHYRVHQPDGSVTDVETIAQPVRDAQGCVFKVVGTVMDVTERNRTRDALRVSEQLARGQLQVLMRMLDAISLEASTDRMLDVKLRLIVEQFGAYSVTMWLTDTEHRVGPDLSHRVRFAYQFVNNRLFAGADAPHPAARLSLTDQDNPVWQKILRTKQHAICEDVATDPDVPFKAYNQSQGIVTILVVPMLVAAEVAGMVAITFRESRTFRPEDIALAQAFANQGMLVIQLVRAAVIAERNRIARDVHDTLAQGLTGVIVQLEAADDAASLGLDGEAADHRARAAEMARVGLQEARRSVMALRPQALEHQDLATALTDLVSRMANGHSLSAVFKQRGAPRRLPLVWEEHLLRIGQEALTNALRHARPHYVVVELIFSASDVRLEVRDDGHGFDPGAPSEGNGLNNMRARIASIGGRLTIQSTTSGGTTVAATLPVSAL